MQPMKPSLFNVIVPCDTKKGRFLLYNTLTGAILVIGRDERQLVEAFEETTPLLTDNESSTFVQTLIDHGCLVPRERSEGEGYLESLWATRNKKGGQLDITLLTNLGPCNFACSYCIQSGAHDNGSLDDRTIASIKSKAIPFIKSQCTKLEADRLRVTYYGSEPLVNQKAVQVVVDTATNLQRYCDARKIGFHFGMVTNGYNLTPERVDQLVPFGFKHAQITIDGDRATHNRTRPLQGGGGTYDRIMENLEGYAGKIATDVLCVVNQNRIPAAYRLVDTLADKGFTKRHVHVQFAPESPDTRKETTLKIHRYYATDGTRMMEAEKRLLVEVAKLSIYANRKGLFNRLLPQRTWCAMQRHNERHLVIEPDGTLRTCATLVGREGFEAGHTNTGVGGIDATIQDHYQRDPECLRCKYLPICADCRVDNLQKQGDILATKSYKEEYDQIVPLLLNAHYRSLKQRETGHLPQGKKKGGDRP